MTKSARFGNNCVIATANYFPKGNIPWLHAPKLWLLAP